MGKKSRRKKPTPRGGGAAHSNLRPASGADSVRAESAPDKFILQRFRQPTDEFYGFTSTESEIFLKVGIDMAREMAHPDSPDYEEEFETPVQNLMEFLCLVALPLKKDGETFENTLRMAWRWPTFKPHWHRVRRRICDYCGKRNDLSEPRLWVCAGCGVARYCGENCQAGDFSHHAKCCPVLARQWDGAGSIPTQLFALPGAAMNPEVLPSARARERLLDDFVDKMIDERMAKETAIL